jgi:PIN domain nuclease of toxin-antitoxin system
VSFLLDTHVVFWSLIEDTQLSPTARDALGRVDTDVFVSVASAWEMAIKVGIEKWPEAAALVANFEAEISVPGFRLLPITVAHVRAAGTLVSPHRDPFDRLLAAQASIEGLTLVSADPIVGTLGAPVLW